MPKPSPTRCTTPCAVTNRATKRNTTQTGDYSEAAFLLKATSLGFAVAKPWSNSERYDFILDNGARLWRVQVKCTASLRARGYDSAAISLQDAFTRCPKAIPRHPQKLCHLERSRETLCV